MMLAALNDFTYKYATLLRVLRNAPLAEGEALVCLAGIQRNHSETELEFHYGLKYIHYKHKKYMSRHRKTTEDSQKWKKMLQLSAGHNKIEEASLSVSLSVFSL